MTHCQSAATQPRRGCFQQVSFQHQTMSTRQRGRWMHTTQLGSNPIVAEAAAGLLMFSVKALHHFAEIESTTLIYFLLISPFQSTSSVPARMNRKFKTKKNIIDWLSQQEIDWCLKLLLQHRTTSRKHSLITSLQCCYCTYRTHLGNHLESDRETLSIKGSFPQLTPTTVQSSLLLT